MRHLLGLRSLNSSQIHELLAYSRETLENRAQRPEERTATGTLDRQLAVLLWPTGAKTTRDREIPAMFREAASSSGLLSTVAYPDPVESFEDVLRSTKSIADASGLQLTGLVVRHASAGVPQQIAQIASRLEPRAFVINAGDGSNEDPTLALAHILWLLNTVTSSGSEMKCLIVGDLALDPLARSLAYGLSLIGAQIQVVGPISLVPAAWGAERNVIVNHTLSSLEFEPDVVFGIPISRPMSEDVLLSEEEYKIVVPLDNFAATTRTALFIKCENSKPNIFIDPFASLTTLTLGNRLRTLPAEFKPAAIYGALRFCEIHQSPSN